MDGLGENLKKVMLAGVGAVAVTAEKSKELLDEMVKKGELTVEQGKVLNEELKHNIRQTMKESQCISQTEFPRSAAGDDWKDDNGAVSGSERSHCEDGDARKTDRRR